MLPWPDPSSQTATKREMFYEASPLKEITSALQALYNSGVSLSPLQTSIFLYILKLKDLSWCKGFSKVGITIALIVVILYCLPSINPNFKMWIWNVSQYQSKLGKDLLFIQILWACFVNFNYVQTGLFH